MGWEILMSTIPAEQAEKPASSAYGNPVVNGFYRTVIENLEAAPDGASAATAVTAAFERHYLSAVQANQALSADVRRISGDDAAKAQMLTHASRFAGRMMEETLRTVGRLHAYEDLERRLRDLVAQLDEIQPAASSLIREVLGAVPLTPPAPVAAGTVVIAHAADHRWTTGWFADGDGPLKPLPFVGWVLTAETPDAPAQGVESAYAMGGTWYTKGELATRGLRFKRLD
jgi:hypothetical protein